MRWIARCSVAGLAVIAGGLATALAQGAPPPPVTVATPLAKRITTWDEYSGRFEAIESVEVRPRVSGFVEKIHFKDGQLVKAGEPLFTIDPRPFTIAVDSAKADVARAQAQVDLADNEVERARPLVKSAAVTERDFDQRKANLAVTKAALQASQANLKSAELNLEWSKVVAPISGRISDRKIDVGNLVTGGAASPALLATIVTVDPIHFIFDVSESDFLRYSRLNLSGERASSREVSNPVKIRLADEKDFTHAGKMDFVDNALNPRSGTLRGRAIVQNTNQLLQPGLFGRVALFGGDADALLIPDSAIVSDQMRKIVFTVGDDGVIKGTPVVIGPIDGGLRVVTSGLSASDRIVIDGLANPMVRPGAKVTPEPGEIKTATTTAN